VALRPPIQVAVHQAVIQRQVIQHARPQQLLRAVQLLRAIQVAAAVTALLRLRRAPQVAVVTVRRRHHLHHLHHHLAVQAVQAAVRRHHLLPAVQAVVRVADDEKVKA
jgi:hypothetical protein